MSSSPFIEFLRQGQAGGGFPVDDALAAMLPLIHRCVAFHEIGQVAPLRNLADLVVEDGHILGLREDAGLEPLRNDAGVQALDCSRSGGVDVVGAYRRDVDEDEGVLGRVNLEVAEDAPSLTRPVYLTGYRCWEHLAGHHDALTDIHTLGLLLASLVCGLDFTGRSDLERFVDARENLFALAPMHPVIAATLVEMTELSRIRRAQDLRGILRRLENYRDAPLDTDVLSQPIPAGSNRRQVIQTHLRDRLFDISRRNRLLYFRSSQATLNLTTASVPLVLDVRNIRPEQLFFWHDELAAAFQSGRVISLQKWLRMEEAPYLPGQLDRLISDARRSRAEYGFSQLRIVIAFLRWNNLRENPEERIHSPLLLVPADLAKRRGVKDQYTLTPQGAEAEVNPALRHHLKQLYNLDLPEQIDLRETSVADFHEALLKAIQATEPGVRLTLADKPRIRLIHERARQRLAQYRRRMAGQGRSVSRRSPLDASYDPADFRPMGLQMFHQWVRPVPLPLRETAGAPPRPRTPFVTGDPKLYTLVEEAEGNPYAWEIDLCAVTLANFNYRKMTLVRDYAALIEQSRPHPAFDRIFSIDPRPVESAEPAPLEPSEQHLILAADATQTGAIARARQGGSLIIQGPPGTGKSQTITNLIADYVARGQRVLFVCEKRAAIDVVYHRLRQQGLDELCCLIHDSQTDKKAFVLNLKETYEAWIDAGVELDTGNEVKRAAALATVESELGALREFAAHLSREVSAAGTTPAGLLRRLIELRGRHDGSACPELTAEENDRLPDYAVWLQHGSSVHTLAGVLRDLGGDEIFARHPLRRLGEAVLARESPLDGLEHQLATAKNTLLHLEQRLRATGLPAAHCDTLEKIAALLHFADRLAPLARMGLTDLLDSASPRAADFDKLRKQAAAKQRKLAQCQEKTVHWREKLPPEDTAAALAVAARVSGWLGFLRPDWWRLRKVLRTRYDFSKHAVAPEWGSVLAALDAEHKAAAALAEVRETCLRDFSCDDPGAIHEELSALRDPAAPPEVDALRAMWRISGTRAAAVDAVAGLLPGFEGLTADLTTLLHPTALEADVQTIADGLDGLRGAIDVLPELLPALRELAATPDKLRRAVRELPCTPAQLEAACARKSLEEFYREQRAFHRTDSPQLRRKLDRLAKAHREWLGSNADWIRARVRQRFVDHVHLTTQPAAALTPEEKHFKKTYSKGRRALEHEFGKTMRYRSIRDLAAGETGKVVRDLKPIWLMSPLSVSDTLPLDAGLFDIVIFDEASQIPVEDAVPAACRAQQVIVVGDEMQLPPTTFFSSAGDRDDEELTLEEGGETVSILMDADSFLTQCARNLPSTLLAWHYRSRYEALISFSNAAFYGGGLYTIPDRQLSITRASELIARDAPDAARLVPEVLARPISFIHCTSGVYQNRRNPAEAAVIAHLIRAILQTESRHSIGVAAFSEAQQGEIEQALETLAADDPVFATRLEAEMAREEDDQFCGLFVKNLENVQGDERDLLLMSVCYAPDAGGQMRMNFGPINQRGGEKRLNVIFSRARHHMVLVSSIRHAQITNDYNDGARALKQFLHYAECLSRGEPALARQVLEGLAPQRRKAKPPDEVQNLPAAQIAAALTGRGWLAEVSAGQSRFRCDVAVRPPGSDRHHLAVLIETGSGPHILERFHTRPEILRAFGWKVVLVTLKDWWHEPAAVLDRIERTLRND